MRRRGNKSSKVPNVKLRPSQPGELSTREPDSLCWAQDSQESNYASGSIVDLCPRPFKGVVICATGIADKPTLFKQAVELGAMSVDAFTDRVTHLVATDHGSAKYKCALERKIPIALPSWVTECYQIWLRGDDVDLDESVNNHRLPIFSGVTITLSGIMDIARRTEITKLLTKQRGSYVKNLERPVKVTHLLCSGDEETEKIRYAEKFNKKGEAKIHMIWEEWFWDCLEFGGRFDESAYQIRQPRPTRKSIPEGINSLPSSEAQPPEPNPPASSDQEEPEEMVTVTRLPAVTLQVWQSLLKPRGFEISAGRLVCSPSKLPGSQGPVAHSTPTRFIPAGDPVPGGSIISSFRRANSFAPQQNEEARSRQPFRRTATSLTMPSRQGNNSESVTDVSCCPFLFKGLKFRTIGEARCFNVRTAIEKSSGVLVPESATEDGDVDYIIVRLVSGSKLFRQEIEERERKKYRTECWLERCIYEERICSADEHPSFTPLGIETPVAGAEDIHLSLSGFDESESWAIRRLVRALGINQAPNFSRRSTHLLCPSGVGDKFKKAREWKIPIVNMNWLVDISTMGIVKPVAAYLVDGPNDHQISRTSTIARNNEAAIVESKMVEITNAHGVGHGRNASHFFESIERRKPPEDSHGDFLDANTGFLRPSTQPLDSSSQHTNGAPETCTQSTLEYATGSHSFLAIDSQEQVPSSESPSPMKMPNNQLPCPAKVPNEVTRALQDSIASLLGKRAISGEDAAGRGGKRSRPQPRSKLQSRKPSSSGLQDQRAVSPPQLYQSPERFEAFEGSREIDPTEESVRVTYEDPGERDEKKRLMSLFENQAGGSIEEAERASGGRKKSKLVRRSVRVAGF